MFFSYDLNSPEPQIASISRLRLRIGDTVLESGPRPQPKRTNYDNDEIDYFLTNSGDEELALAVAYETLAAEWSSVVDSWLGPHRERPTKNAENYLKLANEIRSKQRNQTAGFSATASPRRVAAGGLQ